ncbi:MFS transporter [Kribbella ginsengisoli]|uniref:MFS transporter n=1 Tax=Kribbella ginsengisoli TaxID=363865 RepID=A0ABP6W787_9ACTN
MTVAGDGRAAVAAGSAAPGRLALSSRGGRWLIAVTALGSGIVFLDGSVVNVALPSIARNLGGGFATLQWVMDGYLLTLSALLLLGGALGDRRGRKQLFLIGLVIFTAASIACGLAPTPAVLVAARLAQGIGGALLVPSSLALIDGVIRADDRGRAIGAWAGLSGVSSALGPLLGGWLVDTISWRAVFLINVPLAAIALAATVRHVPESRMAAPGRLDAAGAVAATLGLGGVTIALIEVPMNGWTPVTIAAGVCGAALLVAFVVIESRHPAPLLPLTMFRSRQFAGANLLTFMIYGALSLGLFLLSLFLQMSMRYSATQAGLATLPITLEILLLSTWVGAVTQRTGPRLAMVAGPLLAAAGFVLLSGIGLDTRYLSGVLPGVLVFGLGLAITIAPLTSAVLASVGDDRAGAASGANNAIARVAGLISVAVLPGAAGVEVRSAADAGSLSAGFGTSMLISAAMCAVGGLIAFLTVRSGVSVRRNALPGVQHACQPVVLRHD